MSPIFSRDFSDPAHLLLAEKQVRVEDMAQGVTQAATDVAKSLDVTMEQFKD